MQFKLAVKPHGNTTHGGKGTRLYDTWRKMKQRCYNPNDPKFPLYGGRGITVCRAWRYDFAAFREWALANGYANNLTIDRRNNDGNYEPSNCHWATAYQQSRNRRSVIRLTAFGETKSIAEWAADARCAVSYDSLRYRVVKFGWDHERAIVTPSRLARCG